MNDAASDSRKATAVATSSDRPKRPSGVASSMGFIMGCWANSARPMGVSMSPGASELTRPPRFPHRTAARAQARISGASARFELATPPDAGFHFAGLPPGAQQALPHAFLDTDTQAQIVGAAAVPLGPEPLIGSQRILLKLGEKEITIGTDGLAPFAILPPAGEAPVAATR